MKTSYFLLFLFILFVNAHAYLDPGTGSYVLQVAIAAIAGSFFAIKMSWAKLKNKFKNGQENDDKE